MTTLSNKTASNRCVSAERRRTHINSSFTLLIQVNYMTLQINTSVLHSDVILTLIAGCSQRGRKDIVLLIHFGNDVVCKE